MAYPMKEFQSYWGGSDYREMTPEEYEDEIKWFREYVDNHTGDTCRRGQDYLDYLKRWFGDGRCDGLPNFATRYAMHKLPMSYLVYMHG